MLAPVLLLAAVLPQTEESPSPRERLDALIESTNELEHFSAEYSVEGSEAIKHVWVDYRAPQSIRLRMENPEGQTVWGIGDSTIWMDRAGTGGEALYAQVDLLDRGGDCEEAIAVIADNGWNSTDGPSVGFAWEWRFDADRDKHAFDLSVSTALAGSHDHTRLLGWLHTIEHLDGELHFEGDALVHRSKRAEAHVDVATGFLRRLSLTSADGVRVEFQLEALDLEVPPDSTCFEPLAPDPSAADQSSDLRSKFVSRLQVRRFALEHVHRLLEKGSSRFDNELHGQLERFLTALYDPKLTGELAAWIESTKQEAIVFSDWIRTQSQAGRPLDELEGFATARRAELKATLDGLRATLEQIAPSEIPNYPDSRHWKVIRDLENTVLEARFDLLIAEPLLDDFDARVAAALGR